MKILLITDNHAPTGGAENYFFELKRRLALQSNLEVFSLGFGSRNEYGDNYRILKVSQSRLVQFFWRFFFNPWMYLKLRHTIKKINPTIIHLHNYRQHTKSLLAAVQPYPVVHTVHDFSLICPTGQNLHKDKQPCPTGIRWRCFWQHHTKHSALIFLLLTYHFFYVRRRLKKIVNQFIAPSPLLAEYLQKNGFQPVLYLPPFKKENVAGNLNRIQETTFLYAGHLGNHKGTALLLDEFAIACLNHPELKLNIAGSGAEETRLRAQVKQLNIAKQVCFLGWQENLDKYYDECIAVIFPSIGLESFGLVMTDAMANKRPVIGANRGTIAWLVDHNHTGLLFDPLKRGDLAAKLSALKNNRPLATIFGNNGFKKLNRLINNNDIITRMMTIYENHTHTHFLPVLDISSD